MRLKTYPLLAAALLSSAVLGKDFTNVDPKTWVPEILDGRFLKEFKGQPVSMSSGFFGDRSRLAWGYPNLDNTMRGVIKTIFIDALSPYKRLMMVCASPQGLTELTAEEERREPLRNKGLTMPGRISGTVKQVVFDNDEKTGVIRIELEPGCKVEFVIPALTAEQEAALPELKLPSYLASTLERLESTAKYALKISMSELHQAMMLDQQITLDEFQLLERVYQGHADFRVTNTDSGESFIYRNYLVDSTRNTFTSVFTEYGPGISAELALHLWHNEQLEPQLLLAILGSEASYKAMLWHVAQQLGQAYEPSFESGTKSVIMQQAVKPGFELEKKVAEQADKDRLRDFWVDVIQQSSFMRPEGTEPLPDYSFNFLRPTDSDRAKQIRERQRDKLPMEPLVTAADVISDKWVEINVPVKVYSRIKLSADKGPNVYKGEVDEVDLWNAIIADQRIDSDEYRLLRALFQGDKAVRIIASDRDASTHPPYIYHFNFKPRMRMLGFSMPHYTKRRLIMHLQTNGGFEQLDPAIPEFMVDNQVYNFMNDLNTQLISSPQLIPFNLARQLRDHLHSNRQINPEFKALLNELAGPAPLVWLKSMYEGQEYKILFINFWHDNAKKELLK